MIIELFGRGTLIGFAIAAPVGPIGMLVIRRTLAEGRLLGLLTGLGAAAADSLYGCVGAFGLTFITGFLVGYAVWTKLIGGAFLSTMVLTLANPATILSFMAVFAGLGLGTKPGDYGAAGIVVASVFVGSAIWWLMLSGGVALVRHKLKATTMEWVNRGSGTLLLLFGLFAVISSSS